MSPNERPVSAQPPEETEGPDLQPLPHAATGLTAVIKSTNLSLSAMGVSRSVKTLLKVNQIGGFDCPSCAWADPEDHRSVAEFCENGAKAIAEEATTKRVTPEFFAEWSVEDLSRQSDHWLGTQGRLTHPMYLPANSSHYEPITWDAAFSLIAAELNTLGSPDEAVFYTSGRTSNEAAFLYQLFVRMFGTNNLPDCSNMCHESSGVGLRETIGIGKSTVTLEDLEHSECIFVIGQNPGTNHPRMLSSLQAAVRNGATIVSVNPLPEVGLIRFNHPQEISGIFGNGTALAKLHLPVRINGDVALLKGILRVLVEDGAVDHDFIRDHTNGFEELAAHLRASSWEEIIEQSGISEEKIRKAAEIVKNSHSMVICWAMGLTQHKNAVENIRELVNLLLLRGNIGKPNAGVCCVRGHSNVQGDRTMGIWEKMDDGFLNRLADEFHFDPPRHHGLDTVASIQAMQQGRAHVFFALGGNFLSATPDTEYTAGALKKCRLTVQVSTKLNRSHLVTGKTALILPCLGRTEKDKQASGEQFVTVENSLNVVSTSKGVLEPGSEHLRSEAAIVAGVARATLGNRGNVDWEAMVSDYDRVRDAISRVVAGFSDFNSRVRKPGGFRLDNPARRREFRTASGKANFTVNPIRPIRLEADEYLMMSIRTHDQFNTTIYGLDDRYRGVYNGRRVIFMNHEDMVEAHLAKEDVVDIHSDFGGTRRTARRFIVVPYDIPRRCVATYFPETNVLVPIDSQAEKSGTPTSKSVVVTLTRYIPGPSAG